MRVFGFVRLGFSAASVKFNVVEAATAKRSSMESVTLLRDVHLEDIIFVIRFFDILERVDDDRRRYGTRGLVFNELETAVPDHRLS